MKKFLFTLIVFIIIISLFPLASSARTGYVSDMLFLTFRQGPGNSYAVEKTLISNTQVLILEEKNGFYKVELESKEVGWVDKDFIIFTLPKTLMINKLEKENKNLSNKITELQSSFGELRDKLSSMEQNDSQTKEKLEMSLKTALEEKNKTTNMLSNTREKYDTLTRQSKNIQKIVIENKVLKEQTQTLSGELEIIKEKRKNLFKTGMIKWFLTGSGVLLLGWIIGQSVSSRKQHSSSLLG
ncbi:MAG: TIGR04211 family SH3 domain-containing protein [Deltaproteobacteria bacterium]|jgi:SH3 domain protein|nr:TIGR04211 family SH3 domain-containing protein [Deltaproteobacteria bacterium]